ncbi:unnamed protein product [Angiostrongylus costaricensis]|uniref:Ovule protein n=1 Tax=Angiostrongylus costaricensis TaxID=334426 RepID=A0A0R3PWZ8_ANGCS|nr:unnamed protein product [Angiostrongylus costaricensis]
MGPIVLRNDHETMDGSPCTREPRSVVLNHNGFEDDEIHDFMEIGSEDSVEDVANTDTKSQIGKEIEDVIPQGISDGEQTALRSYACSADTESQVIPALKEVSGSSPSILLAIEELYVRENLMKQIVVTC